MGDLTFVDTSSYNRFLVLSIVENYAVVHQVLIRIFRTYNSAIQVVSVLLSAVKSLQFITRRLKPIKYFFVAYSEKRKFFPQKDSKLWKYYSCSYYYADARRNSPPPLKFFLNVDSNLYDILIKSRVSNLTLQMPKAALVKSVKLAHIFF